MHRPVLITPASPIVTAEEAMRQCRIDADALDTGALAEATTLLEGYIAAATALLDGWNGVLGGVCLGQQTWQQDFDRFDQYLELPLSPVIAISSVTWRDPSGSEDTVAPENYQRLIGPGGSSVCRFRNSFNLPSAVDEVAGVSVRFTAGYNDVPKAITQAILLMVGAWYENREETVIGVSTTSLPDSVAVERLVGAYRRVSL